MAEAAGGAAQVNSLEIGPVARVVSAGRISVRLNVALMKADVGIPGDGMKRIYPAEMALGTRWPGPANAIEVRPVAVGIGTTGRPVQVDVVCVQGIRVNPPRGGMDRILVAEMALGAGDLGNSTTIIRPVTLGARLRIGRRRRLVNRRQPIGRVLPAYQVEIVLGIRIPASGQKKTGEQQQERRQRNFSYRWHALHLSLLVRPWHGRQEAGSILPSIWCRLR